MTRNTISFKEIRDKKLLKCPNCHKNDLSIVKYYHDLKKDIFRYDKGSLCFVDSVAIGITLSNYAIECNNCLFSATIRSDTIKDHELGDA